MRTPTWSEILRKMVDRLIEQGPVVIVLCIILGIIAYVVWKHAWPWLTSTTTKALLEAQASREQRSQELEHDKKDKRELHKTARLLGVDVRKLSDTTERHGEKIDGLKREVADIPGKVIDGLTRKVDDIPGKVEDRLRASRLVGES